MSNDQMTAILTAVLTIAAMVPIGWGIKWAITTHGLVGFIPVMAVIFGLAFWLDRKGI